ncbi:MAG: type II secretion system F family protein [Planctomycetota bacterium]|nr:type II secretion system F family protein [Planctomycetota bacterium]
MPQFDYTARTADGQDIQGTITAASKQETLHILSQQSLFPLHVEDTTPAQPFWKPRQKVKPSLVASNLTQLADLLKNGVPLLKSLEILAKQSAQPALAEVLCDLRDKVAEGTGLDEAMAEHPAVFGELTVSMVRAGSEGAFLEDALNRTAGFLELQEELKGRIVGAMMYPAFLAAMGTVVTIVLVVFFVPKFSELFERLERDGGGLPMATVILLAISDFLGRFGALVAVVLGVLVYWAGTAVKTDRGRLFADRWKLRLPVVGKILLDSAVSRFCRVLGTLLENGVPLLKSLDISSESTGNVILAQTIRESAVNISAGETLAKPLAASGLLPRSVMAMISVAEESNNLDAVLINIADGIDKKVSRQLDIMVRMVEPVMLLVMGLVIGFVMVALLLPVFDMSSALN